ncbi:tetratricopeptide repeat protein [Granulicella arctica]|uniref:tetratricopeptide repeat protein n=1 Tax=Granulicella arctica TaxID=940613 RepID=UPI0021E085AE|nr:tetratricopeptide repeat protein [Granulicella arctica]
MVLERMLFFVATMLFLQQSAIAQASNEPYREMLITIQQHIQQNDLQGAQQLISTAITKYPADGGLENLRGVIEIQQGHADLAIKAFSAAVAHAPGLTSAYLNLGRVYTQSAESDKAARVSALRIYDKLLRREPGNPEANYQAAMLLMWDHSFQLSMEHLERLSEADRGRIGAQIVLCADEAALNHPAGTDKAAAAIIAAQDLTEQDAMEVLPALRTAHRADLIETIFAAANDRDPLSPEGLRILGLAQEGEGKLAPARATLERAFAQSHSSVAILIDLTRVAKAAKDYQGALGYLAHARDLQPNDASFAYEFGVLTIRMGLLGESRKAMAEAVRLEPNNAEYNFGMGIVSSFSQDATQGLPYLQKYHTLRPSDPAALLSIGTSYFRAKNYDSAAVWLRQAVAHQSTAADARYYLGRIARVQGNLDSAKQELEQSNTLGPDRPDVLAELGQVSLMKHDYSPAGVYFDRAIALDPENYAANFGLLQLYARQSDPRQEEQSKRFDEIKNKSEEQYQEMMRIISTRAEEAPKPEAPH